MGKELPKTPRRPDVRLILDNISGHPVIFANPGDRSNKAETIPASGDQTAAMVMLQGETLSEQFHHAQDLVQRYELNREGLSQRFISDLTAGILTEVLEAYGPASIVDQRDQLETILWKDAQGKIESITPFKGNICAYGARPPRLEAAFRLNTVLLVEGTVTSPEFFETSGIVIAVEHNDRTDQDETKPIVNVVAEQFYGSDFANMPVVQASMDGFVHSIYLQDESDSVINVELQPSLNLGSGPSETRLSYG